jgi:Thioredoxin-like
MRQVVFVLFLFLTAILGFGRAGGNAKKFTIERKATIRFHLVDHTSHDTIFVEAIKTLITPYGQATANLEIPRQRLLCELDKDGNGRVQIDLDDEIEYLSLSKRYDSKLDTHIPFLDFCPIEAGDSLGITMAVNKAEVSRGEGNIRSTQEYDLSFAGVGAVQLQDIYNCRRFLVSPESWPINHLPIFNSESRYDPNNFEFWHWRAVFMQYDAMCSGQRSAVLDLNRADLIGDFYSDIARTLAVYHIRHGSVDPLALTYLKRGLDSLLGESSAWAQARSKAYAEGLYSLERSLFLFKYGTKADSLLYWHIRRNFSGELEGKMLVNFFIGGNGQIASSRVIAKNIEAAPLDPWYRRQLLRVFHKIPGSAAFNFQLYNAAGRVVSLKDFKGRVVCMDFFFTGCSACKHYYNDCLQAVEDTFRISNNVVFISVSVDKDKAMWLNTLMSGNYTSVGRRNVLNLYTGGKGYDEDMVKYYDMGGFPVQLLIDPDGRIVAYKSDDFAQKENLIRRIRTVMRPPGDILKSNRLK